MSLLGVLLCCTSFLFQVNTSLEKIREAYLVAVKSDAESLDALEESLKGIKSPSPLQQGYLATLTGLRAKSAFNPMTKVDYVKKALSIFEKAIHSDPTNVELRYLRFSFEDNIPRFLSMSTHLKEDKMIILKGLSQYKQSEPSFSKYIVAYLNKTKELTNIEKSNLSK